MMFFLILLLFGGTVFAQETAYTAGAGVELDVRAGVRGPYGMGHDERAASFGTPRGQVGVRVTWRGVTREGRPFEWRNIFRIEAGGAIELADGDRATLPRGEVRLTLVREESGDNPVAYFGGRRRARSIGTVLFRRDVAMGARSQVSVEVVEWEWGLGGPSESMVQRRRGRAQMSESGLAAQRVRGQIQLLGGSLVQVIRRSGDEGLRAFFDLGRLSGDLMVGPPIGRSLVLRVGTSASAGVSVPMRLQAGLVVRIELAVLARNGQDSVVFGVDAGLRGSYYHDPGASEDPLGYGEYFSEFGIRTRF